MDFYIYDFTNIKKFQGLPHIYQFITITKLAHINIISFAIIINDIHKNNYK